MRVTAGSEWSPLASVVVKHARDAFGSQARIAREWFALGFTAEPDFSRACDESDALVALLRDSGADFITLEPAEDDVTIDAIYTRDAAIVSERGVILCRMGKSARAGEPEQHRREYLRRDIPIAGTIESPGTLEGGDFVWLAPRVAAVGHGYRTNAEGIRQLRALLGDSVDELLVVPLPHWKGHGDVFHLMSIVSPVDRDLAVVYAPLMPVPFRERMIELGYSFVEVPDAEFDTMGANVLALAPRRCLALEGNPVTRARLEQMGAEVLTYSGTEISLKGGGGPTCLTRPLARVER